MLTYVDDYYHNGADKTIITQLQRRHPLKNMGAPTTYVGIQISRTQHATILHQQQCIERAMHKHHPTQTLRYTTTGFRKPSIK
eukprot:Pgem_evm1s4918